jgi:hypothetical protein
MAGSVRLARLVAALTFVRRGLRRCALGLTSAEIGAVGTITTAAAMAPATPVHSETILTAIALIMAILVRARILLRLSTTAATASNECRKSTNLVAAFLPALVGLLARLLVRLLLVLRTILDLLVAWREGLRVTRHVGLLLWLLNGLRHLRLWRIARLVLTHERLAVVLAVVEVVVSRALRRAALLALLRLLIVVVGVLLAELLLRSGDQAEIMLGVLVVIFGGDRITRALRVARKLDVFFRDVRCGATDFYVGAV